MPVNMHAGEIELEKERRPAKIHWPLLAILALETLLGERYFPGWRLQMIATTMPTAFAVICGSKLYAKKGYWILIAALTMLIWVVNLNLRSWMNDVGIVLALGIVGVPEMLAIMAVVVRVFPEAKTR